MATSTSSEDTDKSICRPTCNLCLELFKEPKILPCLHRYCKGCLNTLMQWRHKKFRCPECWEEIEVPPSKADGFETDFEMKSLVQIEQSKEALQMENICKCYNCSENLRAVAYCLKCNDFLCRNCCNSHTKKKTSKDHKLQILFHDDDVDSKHFTVDKLASLMDAPRCHAHPNNHATVYCETCNNLPVCHKCTADSAHKGHRHGDVVTLAKRRKEKLREKLKTLETIKDTLYVIPQQKGYGERSLKAIHYDEIMTVKEKIKDVREGLKLVKAEREAFKQTALTSLEEEMEKEIKQVKDKYKKIFHDTERKTSEEFQPRQNSLEVELNTLLLELERLEREEKDFIHLKRHENTTFTTSGELDSTNKQRMESLKEVASAILASKNNWAAAECIPSLSAAIDTLMDDINKKSPSSEFDHAANIYARSIFRKEDAPRMSEEAEKTVTIDAIQRNARVTGITSSGDGNIVITGRCSSGDASYIFVIDETGKTVRETTLSSSVNRPWRYCDYLSHFKVASVCERTEVGLYDVSDGSYTGKNISDIISTWPENRDVMCVATDSVNKHILVGGYDSREVYVFDDQLNYRGYTISLPEEIRWPRDLAVRGSCLLVCDRDGKRSFLTTMGVSKSSILCELEKPDSYDWRPVNVCTDMNGFIYMLWQTINKSLTTKRCVVVQYSKNGRQKMTTRPVDGDAQCIATLNTEKESKLLVQTWETGKLFIYSLL